MKNNNFKNKQRISNVSFNKDHKKNFNKVNNGVFVFTRSLSVGELAKQLNILPSDIIKYFFLQKKMVTINQMLDDDSIGEVCLNFGYDVKKEKVVSAENFEEVEIKDKKEDLVERPPVITIMGHVDHGKTTLIDAIRNSHVAAGEVGGISQAIGAYQKDVKGKKITFIDTPGHEAFTAMRSRGASVTDIVVLVVAADDGVMPQTIEAIDHARAAKAPIIVAINKIDKDGANPEKVKNELMNHEIIPEEYGGENIFCEISAKTGKGLDNLLESIITLSEVLELKANPNRYAMGTVLEAKLDKGEGPKATLLVQNGTLNNSDYVVVGTSYGHIRRMVNEFNKVLKSATPATPVSVTGLSEVPNAGDHFMAFPTEKEARDIAFKRSLAKKEHDLQGSAARSLDDLYKQAQEGEITALNLLIRADSTGSCEALKSSVNKINIPGVKVNVIRATAGAITDSDIALASASNAIIYGFNVRPSANVKAKAEEEKVEIRLHRIIYAMIEEIEGALKGMLKPELKEVSIGQMEVRNLFKANKLTIAGCYVTEGHIKARSKVHLVRDGVVIYDGELGSLKRFKDDASDVKSGFECGATILGYNDIHEGDMIEAYEMKEETVK
ncbi:MAG: translation initiation factor IF-2 [Bacilli bacterium]|nr:translation initiation factor IF-2 [Bacilli bacterium]